MLLITVMPTIFVHFKYKKIMQILMLQSNMYTFSCTYLIEEVCQNVKAETILVGLDIELATIKFCLSVARLRHEI